MDILVMKDIYQSNGENCDWCVFGYDTCKWNFDNKGERPI